jgi:hypothetical protein
MPSEGTPGGAGMSHTAPSIFTGADGRLGSRSTGMAKSTFPVGSIDRSTGFASMVSVRDFPVRVTVTAFELRDEFSAEFDLHPTDANAAT